MEGNGVNPVFFAKHRVSGQGDLEVIGTISRYAPQAVWLPPLQFMEAR